jgi:hypothetical protein
LSLDVYKNFFGCESGVKRCLFLRSWLGADSKLPTKASGALWMRWLALACTCRDTQDKVPPAAVILLNTCGILNRHLVVDARAHLPFLRRMGEAEARGRGGKYCVSGGSWSRVLARVWRGGQQK